ncbi:hypothetical protein HAZT_HAZT001663 [Hyalella azteca]|uniref:E1 domain-containing protein n=1 Tax=Hyalella azteca TaxID=294128 RepID=A0A6A0GYM1_HYAAZ|nr:hypothetical protein HAZT_HAZT001663 [Hyalella azteca]
MVCRGRTEYLAQYQAPTGEWRTNTAPAKITCLKDKLDILHYCKQVSNRPALLQAVPRQIFRARPAKLAATLPVLRSDKTAAGNPTLAAQIAEFVTSQQLL